MSKLKNKEKLDLKRLRLQNNPEIYYLAYLEI